MQWRRFCIRRREPQPEFATYTHSAQIDPPRADALRAPLKRSVYRGSNLFPRQPAHLFSKRPRWQAGHLSGTGGKIRGGDRHSAMKGVLLWIALSAAVAGAQTSGGATAGDRAISERARDYLTDLIRLDTSNPPGNETRVAYYLKRVADAEGIPCEVLGKNPARLNF